MEIQNVIAQLKEILIHNDWKIATAESLTAGLVSSYLASISGSSGYLYGGLVAYTIPIKVEFLDVDEEVALKYNAYHPQVAAEMAIGIRKLYGTNIGISTTGYAEPSEDDGIDVPQAYVAIDFDNELVFRQFLAPDRDMSRNDAREYITKQALIFLLETLQEKLTKQR